VGTPWIYLLSPTPAIEKDNVEEVFVCATPGFPR
jgi:hypothetical protein